MVSPLHATTRAGRPAHIWWRDAGCIYGAWLGGDGWWRACAWRVDGQMNHFQSPQDLLIDQAGIAS